MPDSLREEIAEIIEDESDFAFSPNGRTVYNIITAIKKRLPAKLEPTHGYEYENGYNNAVEKMMKILEAPNA